MSWALGETPEWSSTRRQEACRDISQGSHCANLGTWTQSEWPWAELRSLGTSAFTCCEIQRSKGSLFLPKGDEIKAWPKEDVSILLSRLPKSKWEMLFMHSWPNAGTTISLNILLGVLKTGFFPFLFFFFFFFCYSPNGGKFPGRGSNPSHSGNPSHCSDNTRSLTHWATREFQNRF